MRAIISRADVPYDDDGDENDDKAASGGTLGEGCDTLVESGGRCVSSLGGEEDDQWISLSSHY